jgi:hypothetical protein
LIRLSTTVHNRAHPGAMPCDVAATLSLARTNPGQRSASTISGKYTHRNRRISTPRALVEHVFGAMRHMEEKW